MDDNILILEPKTFPVKIRDGEGNIVKRLTLREMPAGKITRFFRYLQEISLEEFGEGEKLEESFERQSEKLTEFVGWLFGEKLSEDFISDYLTPDMITQIIIAQNRLNGMDDFVKKVMLRSVEAGKGTA